MQKLLFYSHDSYGLGNIRRMLAIASYLVEKHSDIFILLITGSPMLHAFRIHPQIDYVKLPCLFRSKEGIYHSKLQCLKTKSLLQIRSDLITSVVKGYQPDLFLVDKKPEGLGGELRAVIQQLSHLESPPRIVLLLRDILDSPHITKDVWLRHHYFSLIEKYYDEVIVVGQQSVFDTTAEYDFPSSIKNKTYFCGYLKRTYDDNRDEIRHQQIQVGQKMVVVAAGGGNDGREILSTYINGIKNSAWKDKIRSVIFYGPEMDEHDYVGLMESVRGVNNITLMEFTSDFMSYLSAADLVVTMGGYNTVCEIISLHKAAIIVPRATPVAEQLIRAECFSRLEILEYIHPCNLNSVILMEKVHRQLFLDVPSKKRNQINFSGMEALECKLLFQPTRNGCEQTLRESRI